MGRVKESYGEAAGHVGLPIKAPPPSNPHACMAHGCPIAGSIMIDGRKVCFVHFRLPDMATWDAATTRIRNRMPMFEAVRILRNPGALTDSGAVVQAQMLVPDMRTTGFHRYAALAALESRLQDECCEAGDQVQPHQPTTESLVREVVMTHRMTP